MNPSSVRRAVPALLASVLVTLALSATPASTAAAAAWTYVGSGPLATSTKLSVVTKLPTGVLAGDLLLLSCQGRNNRMSWSANGYQWITDYTDWPDGTAGLTHQVFWRWATDREGTSVTVRNTDGINGWSCVSSAFRGGSGTNPVSVNSGSLIPGAKDPTMRDGSVAQPPNLGLVWFVSADDNAHGLVSGGSVAFGGPNYDTTVGTDHAVSMVYASAPGPVTMRQTVRGPDTHMTLAAGLRLQSP